MISGMEVIHKLRMKLVRVHHIQLVSICYRPSTVEFRNKFYRGKFIGVPVLVFAGFPVSVCTLASIIVTETTR